MNVPNYASMGLESSRIQRGFHRANGKGDSVVRVDNASSLSRELEDCISKN